MNKVDNYMDYLEGKLLTIKDKMRRLETQELTDSDKYYRLDIEREVLERAKIIFERNFFGDGK